MGRTHQDLSTCEVWKRYSQWSFCNELKHNNRFDLETWNLQGQGNRKRLQWVELIKVYLHVKFERGIVNGHSAMNLNAITIWPWNLEPSRSRSQTKVAMGRTHQDLSTCELWKRYSQWSFCNELKHNNRFDLETWNLQGQGNRQRSQWVELIKVYLHVKFKRGIVNGHSAMNLNARANPNCWPRRTAPFQRLDFASQSGQKVMV